MFEKVSISSISTICSISLAQVEPFWAERLQEPLSDAVRGSSGNASTLHRRAPEFSEIRFLPWPHHHCQCCEHRFGPDMAGGRQGHDHLRYVGACFPGGLRGRAADAALRRLQTGCFGQLGAFRHVPCRRGGAEPVDSRALLLGCFRGEHPDPPAHGAAPETRQDGALPDALPRALAPGSRFGELSLHHDLHHPSSRSDTAAHPAISTTWPDDLHSADSPRYIFACNLPAAMVTLLQFVSFDNIVHVYKPLGDRDGVLLLYFVLVILVVGIVIMNLVTAVIVNSSLEQAAKDKSLLHAIEEQNRKKVLADLRAMFFRLDHDNSGEVSRDEIAAIAPREQKMLRDLTGFDNAVELFDALDLQESGEIGIEEFCQGLQQIAVSESPLEIKRMQKQVEHIKHHVAKYMAETDQMKSLLHELVSGMQRMESGVNSMSSAAWVAGAPSDQRHSFIAAPGHFFVPLDNDVTHGPRPGLGGETTESGKETHKDSAENGGSSSPSTPTPKKKRIQASNSCSFYMH
ncbi:unnamed protein product [Symbiodinium necroappetens]|uniref:EF-hand domain-containing protein n=1 Tax=Symbiodinium necroappetens TaxID=1628268 RepID=A0A813B8M3_9DINO|nr:unnamed protein product [Symbiodinium necroappetens]